MLGLGFQRTHIPIRKLPIWPLGFCSVPYPILLFSITSVSKKLRNSSIPLVFFIKNSIMLSLESFVDLRFARTTQSGIQFLLKFGDILLKIIRNQKQNVSKFALITILFQFLWLHTLISSRLGFQCEETRGSLHVSINQSFFSAFSSPFLTFSVERARWWWITFSILTIRYFFPCWERYCVAICFHNRSLPDEDQLRHDHRKGPGFVNLWVY